MSPRPESVIFIDKQLVWMTCGVEVGYQVLLAPRTSGIVWLDVIEQAFPHFEIGGQQLRAAEVTPCHCDSSSRPIKHFMLWLDVEPMVFDKAATVSVPELMQQLAPAFSVILEASRYISEPDICRQAWEKQSERSLRLAFSGKNTPVKNAGAKSSTVKSNLPMDTLSSDDEEALVFPKKFMVMAIIMVMLAIIAALFQVFGLA